MDAQQIGEIVDEIQFRAEKMWCEGNPPTPEWWLQRCHEALKLVAKSNIGSRPNN